MSRKHQFILFVTAILQVATVVIIVSKSWVGRPQITRIEGELAYEVNATSYFPKPICNVLAGISAIQHGLWLRSQGVSRPVRVVIECSDGLVKSVWRPADGELKVGSGLTTTSIKTPSFVTNIKPASFEFEAQAAHGYFGDESMQGYWDFAESTATVIEADCHDPYWGSADVQCQVDLRDFGPNECQNATLYAGYQALARLVAEGLPTYGVVDLLSRCAGGRAELQLRYGVANISLMPDDGPEAYRQMSLRYLDPLVFDPNLKEHPLFVAEPESYDRFETEIIPEKPRDYVAETQARQVVMTWWLGYDGEWMTSTDVSCVSRNPDRCAGRVHKSVGPGECRALAIATSLALDMSFERFTCFGSSSLTISNFGSGLGVFETDTSNRPVFSYWFDYLRVPPARSPWMFPVPND